MELNLISFKGFHSVWVGFRNLLGRSENNKRKIFFIFYFFNIFRLMENKRKRNEYKSIFLYLE